MKNENSGFVQLGVESGLVERLCARGISNPTDIQSLVIPRILDGESVVAKSQTGSGKSLAYLVPIIQKVMGEQDSQLLVLAPTRELAIQVGAECESICSLPAAVIYGGVEYEAQRETLASNPRVVIATVGRLRDLIAQGVVNLDNLRYFVLDEVDQMVDMGFRDGIVELARLRCNGAQTLCFSATLGEKEREVLSEIVGEYEVVSVQDESVAVDAISQTGYYVKQALMDQLLLHLLRKSEVTRAIVFCRSRKMADRLNKILNEASMVSEAIHSDRSQKAREHILGRFRTGETQVLVATDLIARGIDVEGVSHVFNFGLPQNPEQYIHRIGRTGRAGAAGEAVSLVCPDEAKLLGETCAFMRKAIVMSTSHPYMTPDVTVALSKR